MSFWFILSSPPPLFFILFSLLAPFSLSQFLSFYYSVSSGLLSGLKFFSFNLKKVKGEERYYTTTRLCYFLKTLWAFSLYEQIPVQSIVKSG